MIEVHPCEAENCQSTETAEYHNQWAEGDDAIEWLCDEHAIESGFCLGCHYFCAGMDSYDFSPIKGYCAECVEEIRYENGEYDDDDNMFALWDYDTWEDIIEEEKGGRWIGPGSENAAPEEIEIPDDLHGDHTGFYVDVSPNGENDDEPIHILGDPNMSEETLNALQELARAARRMMKGDVE
jgi:hypothetical protein